MSDTKKYDSLKNYLSNFELVLSYRKIERIVGSKLPESAYKYREWWANGGHIQAKYWLESGWKVYKVILGKEVIFKPKI